LDGSPGSEVRTRRRTRRFKPAADVNLGVRFAAVMTCAGCVRNLRFPLENGELRFTALDHEPVNRVAADCSANLAAELLERRHSFFSLAIAHGPF